MKKIISLILSLALLVSLSACSEETLISEDNSQKSIEKTEYVINVANEIAMTVGDMEPLNASLVPADESKMLVYASSDEGIATVDEEGNVTAVAEGETELTVSVDDISKTVKVVVKGVIEEDEKETESTPTPEPVVTPSSTATPTPTPAATPKPTCPTCGSADHTTHPQEVKVVASAEPTPEPTPAPTPNTMDNNYIISVPRENGSVTGDGGASITGK